MFIDPVEQEAWDNRRNRAKALYETQKAQGEFQRSNILENQSLDTAELAKRFNRMRERLPGGFARRGLLNSGIYQRALKQYAEDRQAATSSLAARYQQMLGEHGFDQKLQAVQYLNTIGDINDAERVRRAQIAAALQGVTI